MERKGFKIAYPNKFVQLIFRKKNSHRVYFFQKVDYFLIQIHKWSQTQFLFHLVMKIDLIKFSSFL